MDHQLRCDRDVGSKLNRLLRLYGMPDGSRKPIALRAPQLLDRHRLHGIPELG